MKIAWVTPYNTRSAIGRFSRLVVARLRKTGHDVTVVRAETTDLLDTPTHPDDGPVLPWTALHDGHPGTRDFDIIVYNIGDNYLFHAGVLELLPSRPGPVIFHDFYLLHLFCGWRHAGTDPDAANAAIDTVYGTGSAAAALAAMNGPDYLTRTAEQFPMTEWIARMADGAVAHSRFYMERLYIACAGPVVTIPLAYDTLGHFTPLDRRPRSDTLTILTFGYINANKRVESVIRTLASTETLRRHCRYRVVGPIEEDERRRLERIATEMGMTGLSFSGQVSDEELHAHLEAADIICCLRWPTLEGASASAIEAMLSGRPVIVTEAGFFRDLPDDLVFKVRPKHEIMDLRRHLETLVADPGRCAAVGRQAAGWAAQIFSAERYVAAVVPFLEDVIEAQPLLRTIQGLGQTLGEFGLMPGDTAFRRIADAMQDLFIENAGRDTLPAPFSGDSLERNLMSGEG